MHDDEDAFIIVWSWGEKETKMMSKQHIILPPIFTVNNKKKTHLYFVFFFFTHFPIFYDHFYWKAL